MKKHSPTNERIKRKYFAYLKEAKTQADGAFAIPLGGGDRFCRHQVQVEVEGLPESPPPAGTLDVAVKSPGAREFVNLGSIDMTAPDLLRVFGPVFATEIRFTPADFNGTAYNVIVTSGVDG